MVGLVSTSVHPTRPQCTRKHSIILGGSAYISSLVGVSRLPSLLILSDSISILICGLRGTLSRTTSIMICWAQVVSVGQSSSTLTFCDSCFTCRLTIWTARWEFSDTIWTPVITLPQMKIASGKLTTLTDLS